MCKVMCSYNRSEFTNSDVYVWMLINARRIRMRVMVVCLSVCLSVCYQSTDFLRSLYNKVNIPDDFTLISKGFQLWDFSKKLSFKSYSFNRSFLHAKLAIFTL